MYDDKVPCASKLKYILLISSFSLKQWKAQETSDGVL